MGGMPAATKRPTISAALIAVPVLFVLLAAGAFLFGRDRVDGTGTATDESREAGGRTAVSTDPQADDVRQRLMVGETNLVEVAEAGKSLAEFANQPVQGEDLRVVEVVNQFVFWVGRGDDARVLVSIDNTSGAVKILDSQSGEQTDIEVGMVIQLNGTVRLLQGDTELSGLAGADGEDQETLRAQGAYVYADALTID